MKLNSNYNLVKLPDSTFWAKNSISITLDFDIIANDHQQSIFKGNQILASKIGFSHLILNETYITFDSNQCLKICLLKDIGLIDQQFNNNQTEKIIPLSSIECIYQINEVRKPKSQKYD